MMGWICEEKYWIELDWNWLIWTNGFKKIVELVVLIHEGTLCIHCHQVFNILVLEFEYDLKFTLDNIKYMLSNIN